MKETKEKQKKPEMIAQTTIISMGWTKSMINKLLPEPKLVNNPYYKKAAPMKLWEKQEVLKQMETEEFKIELEKANKRKQSAVKALKTKEVNLTKKMKELGQNIEVKLMPEEELIDAVLKYQEEHIKFQMEKNIYYLERHCDSQEAFDEYKEALFEFENFVFQKPNEDTMMRWIVNYIRHHLVKYDLYLCNIQSKVGRESAYEEFKKAVLKKIALTYPQYANECYHQMDWVSYDIYR